MTASTVNGTPIIGDEVDGEIDMVADIEVGVGEGVGVDVGVGVGEGEDVGVGVAGDQLKI